MGWFKSNRFYFLIFVFAFVGLPAYGATIRIPNKMGLVIKIGCW